MERVLFLACVEDDGGLSTTAREALAAAAGFCQASTAPLAVGLIGAQVQGAAEAVAGCGAARFLGVAGADFGASRYATDAAAATALVGVAQASLVVAPQSARLARCLPGVAARLGGRIDTQVTALTADGEAPCLERWYYRQRIVAQLTRTQRPWLVLVAGGMRAPWEGEAGQVAVEPIAVEVADAMRRTRVRGVEAASAGAQTIRPDAELLFVAGAGWTKKQADGAAHPREAEDLILGFLAASGASLGSSKSLVEQSGEGQQVLTFMSHMNQVGQTGSTPRHPKGLSTCCHGEEPHVVGWRFIRERRAVNLDAGCGWALGKADVLYVADAFAVMAELNRLLAGVPPP